MKRLLRDYVYAKCSCGANRFRKRRPPRAHYICPRCGDKVECKDTITEALKKKA